MSLEILALRKDPTCRELCSDLWDILAPPWVMRIERRWPAPFPRRGLYATRYPFIAIMKETVARVMKFLASIRGEDIPGPASRYLETRYVERAVAELN